VSDDLLERSILLCQLSHTVISGVTDGYDGRYARRCVRGLEKPLVNNWRLCKRPCATSGLISDQQGLMLVTGLWFNPQQQGYGSILQW